MADNARCPKCGQLHLPRATVCIGCRATLTPPPTERKWIWLYGALPISITVAVAIASILGHQPKESSPQLPAHPAATQPIEHLPTPTVLALATPIKYMIEAPRNIQQTRSHSQQSRAFVQPAPAVNETPVPTQVSLRDQYIAKIDAYADTIKGASSLLEVLRIHTSLENEMKYESWQHAAPGSLWEIDKRYLQSIGYLIAACKSLENAYEVDDPTIQKVCIRNGLSGISGAQHHMRSTPEADNIASDQFMKRNLSPQLYEKIKKFRHDD